MNNFIPNLLKITKGIRIIILCDSYNTSQQYLIEYARECGISFSKIRQDKDGVRGFQVGHSKIYCLEPFELKSCGERADAIITDISKEDERFRLIILPLLVSRRVSLHDWSDLNKFVWDPIEENIIDIDKNNI